jgi:hypothetical protein
MNKVYLLWFDIDDGCVYESMSSTGIIGVFSTKEKAIQAMNNRFEEILKEIKEKDHDELDKIEKSETKIEYTYKTGWFQSGALYINEQKLDVLFW